MFFRGLLLLFLMLFSVETMASESLLLDGPTDWDSFNKNVDSIDRDNENAGLAYMISGAVVAIGGGITKNQTTDSLTDFSLSLIQGVGVAGIGYGAALYNLSDSNEMFRNTLLMQPDLTLAQRNDMTKNYLSQKREREKKKKIISAVTYGLVAALYTLNAGQTSDNNLQTVYWVLAGANLALCLSFTF